MMVCSICKLAGHSKNNKKFHPQTQEQTQTQEQPHTQTQEQTQEQTQTQTQTQEQPQTQEQTQPQPQTQEQTQTQIQTQCQIWINSSDIDIDNITNKIININKVKNLNLTLLINKDIIKWLYNCEIIKNNTKYNKIIEDNWGRAIMKTRRPDLKLNKQWTNKLGEHLCEELFQLKDIIINKPQSKNGYIPDFETPNEIIEVKTGTYYTSGTASEKILGCPFKYCEVPQLYNKPLVIVCVGGAEYACKKQYKILYESSISQQKQKFIDFFQSK